MAHILFITTDLPYPPNSGGKNKTFRFLKFLSQSHSVTLVCASDAFDRANVLMLKEQLNLDAVYTFDALKKRTAISYTSSRLSGLPLNVFRRKSGRVKAMVDKLVGQVDVIVADHYEAFQYVPIKFPGKVILHHHNAEFVLWERKAAFTDGITARVVRAEAHRVFDFEKKCVERSDQVWLAPNDAIALKAKGLDGSKMRTSLHLGDDSLLDRPELKWEDTTNQFLYYGSLSWEPNKDGLIWFLETMWPKFLEQHSDFKLLIAGKSPDDELLKVMEASNGVEYLGFVGDLEQHFRESKAVLLPLRMGSGMKVRLMENLSRGVPVVTTAIGTEGFMDVQSACLECRDEEEFLNAMSKTLERDAYEGLVNQSRDYARNHLTWAQEEQRMQRNLDELLS